MAFLKKYRIPKRKPPSPDPFAPLVIDLESPPNKNSSDAPEAFKIQATPTFIEIKNKRKRFTPTKIVKIDRAVDRDSD